MRRRDYVSDCEIMALRSRVCSGEFVRPVLVGRLGLELHVDAHGAMWAATFADEGGAERRYDLGSWPDLEDPHAALDALRARLFAGHAAPPVDLEELLVRYDREQLASRASRGPTLRSLRKVLSPWLKTPWSDLGEEIGEALASDLATLSLDAPAQAQRVHHSLMALLRWVEASNWPTDLGAGHLLPRARVVSPDVV